MTPEERALLFVVLTNFPIVFLLLYAGHRGWLVLGATHREQMTHKQKELEDQKARYEQELAFREALRQEGIVDKKVLEEKSAKQAESIKDLTNVVTQSLALNDRLVDESRQERDSERTDRESYRSQWDGVDRRTPASRPRTRRGAPRKS